MGLIGALSALVQCWQGRNRNNGNQGTTIIQRSDTCSFSGIMKFGLIVVILVSAIGFMNLVFESETTTDSPTKSDSTTYISSTTLESISTTDETGSGLGPEPEKP